MGLIAPHMSQDSGEHLVKPVPGDFYRTEQSSEWKFPTQTQMQETGLVGSASCF